MTDALEVRAEVAKLARLLHREPDDLACLHQIPPDDIRRLREQATDVLFAAEGRMLQRLAMASRLLPVPLLATIAQRAFGPLLAGRVTGYLEPSRAVEVSDRLPAPFLADMAVEIDPRRVSEVIARLPTQNVAGATRELLHRGEWVTMGRFVGHLTDQAIVAAFGVVDDEALLRVAFVLEAKERLDHLLGLLPAARRGGVIRAAAHANLWPEALDMLSQLSERRRGELADAAAAQDDAVLDSMVRAARDEGLREALLPVVRSMGEDSRRRFARLSSVLDDPRWSGPLTEPGDQTPGRGS